MFGEQTVSAVNAPALIPVVGLLSLAERSNGIEHPPFLGPLCAAGLPAASIRLSLLKSKKEPVISANKMGCGRRPGADPAVGSPAVPRVVDPVVPPLHQLGPAADPVAELVVFEVCRRDPGFVRLPAVFVRVAAVQFGPFVARSRFEVIVLSGVVLNPSALVEHFRPRETTHAVVGYLLLIAITAVPVAAVPPGHLGAHLSVLLVHAFSDGILYCWINIAW